jgi:hypothetical protein
MSCLTLDKETLFVECLLDWHSTKKALVGPFANYFVECAGRHSEKKPPLPVPLSSTGTTTLDKEALSVSRCAFFTECFGHRTRQRHSLPSVTLGKVTIKPLFYLFLSFHPNKQKIYIVDITYITETTHVSPTP